ncbi:hypothetical protein MNBD_ALPHA06-1224 [hydrothermal vent metagenome]|uniref:HTH LytTR-type domain-containing protein n=1 Tax=hydrothermal vent metagenome TaxID=652676 RepID=A0A3B0S8P6_9ZZZZ
MIARIWQNPKIRRDLILVISIGTLLAFMSPFGASSQMPFIGAWAYWTGLLIWGWIAMQFVGPLLQARLPKLPVFWFYLLVSLIMALLVFPLILIVQGWERTTVPVTGWPYLYFLVWLVSVAITGVSYLSERAFEKPTTKDGSTFMKRIPAKLAGSPLYAVSSEDHYLRIQTACGSDLILMRLVDAVAELDGFDGMQVHRSWWVARQAVKAVERQQNRIFLTLHDDTQVPVSRSFTPQIRKAGWLG